MKRRWRKLADDIEPQLIVILSDINMPGMDGLSLLREIKAQRPNLPVMMVTAYGDDERRRLAGEYRVAAFITKPVDFGRLKAQLQRLSSGFGAWAAAAHPHSGRPRVGSDRRRSPERRPTTTVRRSGQRG